jgi:hypothetical protein
MTPDQKYMQLVRERDMCAYSIVGAAKVAVEFPSRDGLYDFKTLRNLVEDYDCADKALKDFENSTEYQTFVQAVNS